jgi:hypothetical protein
VLAAIVVAAIGLGRADAAVGPDVTVFSITDLGNSTVTDGFCGYSVGTRSCNRGDVPLNWCDQGSGCAPGAGSEDHPVIAQNLYRLKGGRFEQIGMSWLKHGFLSTNSTTAGCTGSAGGSCAGAPFGSNQLGIGCTDPYGSSLNGSRPLGPRSEVDGTTAIFPFPYTSYPGTGSGGTYKNYDQRIKVPTAEMDPTQNPGALYWVEAQYFASDDAAAGNGLNNASHRPITVGGSPNFNIALAGSTIEKKPAIFEWPVFGAPVMLGRADVPGSILARFHVARRVVDMGGGIWHYEYAVHNLNVDRSARGFNVQFPVGTSFTNVGFKDIEYHSGEVYGTADWVTSTTADSISWSTDTFAVDANANALRFASMFNFWFDADQPPSLEASTPVETIDLFKPGAPAGPIVVTGFNELLNEGFEGGNMDAWFGHS